MIPAIPFRAGQYLACRMHVAKESLAWIQVLIGMLAPQDFLLTCVRVNDAKLFGLESAVVAVVVDGLAVGKPFESGGRLERAIRWDRS